MQTHYPTVTDVLGELGKHLVNKGYLLSHSDVVGTQVVWLFVKVYQRAGSL